MPDGNSDDMADEDEPAGSLKQSGRNHVARAGYGIGSAILAISDGGTRAFMIIFAIGAALFFIIWAQANGEEYLLEINPNVIGHIGSVVIYEGTVWIMGLGMGAMAAATAINRLLGIFGIFFAVFLVVVA